MSQKGREGLGPRPEQRAKCSGLADYHKYIVGIDRDKEAGAPEAYVPLEGLLLDRSWT